MPPSPVRMAILMADTPLPGTQSRFGTYGGVFTDLFKRATAPEPVDSVLSITHFDAVANPDLAAYPSLDDVDAVLITGSRHNAFDNAPWIETLVEYARKVLASGRVRLVGVCFGHQIVGRALGVPVGRNDGGWELTVTDVRLSDAGRKFFGLETMRIHQMHRDVVASYPAGAIPLGDTDVCAVQGMLIPGKAVTVQGHPEFSEEIVREILQVRHDGQIISDEDYKFGIDRVGNEHDGVAIAKAFIGFMQGKETD